MQSPFKITAKKTHHLAPLLTCYSQSKRLVYLPQLVEQKLHNCFFPLEMYANNLEPN